MSPPRNASISVCRRRFMTVTALLALAAASVVGIWLCGEVTAWRQGIIVRRALDEGRLNEVSVSLEYWLKAKPRSAEAHYLSARLFRG
jgi:hypothetical protein